jgi:hypothetical protein
MVNDARNSGSGRESDLDDVKRQKSPSRIHIDKIQQRRLNFPAKYRKLYDRVASGAASPRTAIKLMCIECLGGSAGEIAGCTDVACPLFMYRPYKK